MAVGETVYIVASSSRVVLARGRAQVSRLTATRNALAVTPSAATYELLSPSGSILANPTPAIVGSIAEATLTALNLPITLSLGENYSERWTLTIDGIERSFRRMAVLARFELHPPVAESELLSGEYPDLAQNLGNYGTTLQSFMDAAWAELLRTLQRYGSFADILVDSSDVFDLYRHMVLERSFRAMLKFQESERWRGLWEHHRDEMRGARDGLKVQVDRDRDGLADHLGMESIVKSIHQNMAPRRTMRQPWKW